MYFLVALKLGNFLVKELLDLWSQFLASANVWNLKDED